MKALVKYAPGHGNVAIADIPVRKPGPNEILIKVKYCGICGTDLHIYADEFPNDPPVVKGHEYPDQMAQALYYLGRACAVYADEVDSRGGKGDFLREETNRWWSDLQQRYPRSRWAEKVTQK